MRYILILSSFSFAELAANLNSPSVSIHFSLSAKQHSLITNVYVLSVLSKCSFISSPNTGLSVVLSEVREDKEDKEEKE